MEVEVALGTVPPDYDKAEIEYRYFDLFVIAVETPDIKELLVYIEVAPSIFIFPEFNVVPSLQPGDVWTY